MKPKENSERSPGDASAAAATRPRARLNLLAGFALVAVFVLLVQWYLGWGALLAAWSELPPALAAGGLCVLLLSYFVRTLRFYSYFRDRMRGRLLLCMKLTLHHNFLNYVLPMRTGELAFPVLMARYFGIDVTASVPVLVWFRMLDLHTLVLAGILALPLLDVPAVAVAALALSWLPLPWFAYRFNRHLAARLEHARAAGRWTRLTAALRSMPQAHVRFFVSWGWTIANWLTKLAAVTYGVMAFAGASRVPALAASVAGELSMVLPIHSVAATGTYEAAVTAVLVADGMPLDGALAGAINLHLFLIIGVLLTGLIAVSIPGNSRRAGDSSRDENE